MNRSSLIGYHQNMADNDADSGSGRANSPTRWILALFRNRGVGGALRYYAVGFCELLRDLTPERRKSRYGDIEYDFDYGVDTTWATVSLKTRLREWISGGQYQPSEPALFHEILNALPIAPDGFTFVDLGAGKGRTLLMASDYPFRRIIGVEILEELAEIARRNIARYSSDRQKCFDIEAVTGDAQAFRFPAEPTILYLFNPFPEYVLRAVLDHLQQSLRSQPRDVYVIYHNLVHEAVFNELASWLQPVYRTHQFAIYHAYAQPVS